VPLGPWQEWALWNAVVHADGRAAGLLESGAAAEAAAASWALAVEWRLPLARIAAEGNEDCRVFADWARSVRDICDRNGWMEGARLPDRLREGLDAVRLPERIVLAGFDRLSPQQAALADACRARGCAVEVLPAAPQRPAGTAVRAAFPDAEREIEAAARWARRLLETAPGSAIGVVVHDLAARRAAVERAFRSVLEPSWLLAASPDPSALVNFSAGPSLPDYPAIRGALDILGFALEGNPWDRAAGLLACPYLPGATPERGSRARLNLRLRRQGRTHLSMAELVEESTGCPEFRRSLGRWQRVLSGAPARQPAGAWARTFSAVLEAAGWPGDRPLGSVEYQTVKRWEQALSDLAGASLVTGDLERSDALALLARIAARASFQPESPEAPVQVLGTLEAAGQEFDHLWVAGLDDESWPRPSSPDPFLPLRMQREAGTPRCSPERELEFAALATRRLLASAPAVVFSYPERAGDRDLAPSPLILPIPRAGAGEPELWGGAGYAATVREASALESLVDEQGPPVEGGVRLRGGARVFQYQSACPFHAFAELRLGAARPGDPGPGLDAMERGNAVHSALELFWDEVRTHAALCGRGDIPGVVAHAAAEAIARVERDRGAPLGPRFAALERRRLARLLVEWLEVERQRPPFTVLRQERDRDAQAGGIDFRVRLDRVDSLDGGGEAIIDYKTGAVRRSSWEGERPDEPQLPLYGTIHEGPLAAVLYAQVKLGEAKLMGLAKPGTGIRGVEEVDLGECIDEWRRVIERLGARFRAGNAETDPKQPGKSCRHCELAALCRIADAQACRGDEEPEA
jgi:ATP-dependent helicase/nuclease subunit B